MITEHTTRAPLLITDKLERLWADVWCARDLRTAAARNLHKYEAAELKALDDLKAEIELLTEGLCWSCSKPQGHYEARCPHCHAINPNMDLQGALAQQERPLSATHPMRRV